jgi:uncharacterized protein
VKRFFVSRLTFDKLFSKEKHMLYLVIAKDGTDADAPARWQAVRAEHLEKAKGAVELGIIMLGGALLNKEGGMIGSGMLLEAASEEEVWAFLKRDVYFTGKVWQHFEVYPFRKAVQSPKLAELS